MAAAVMEVRLNAQAAGDARSVAEAVALLREELPLLQRALYKNQSQHRRAFFFRHLQHVKRCFRDLKLKDVEAVASDAAKLLEQLQPSSGARHVAWKTLADVTMEADAVLRRLTMVATAMAEVIHAAQKAYKGLEEQFEMTYFMPLALMLNSVLARVVVLSRVILVRCVEAHAAVALLYLSQVTKANPLRARTTAVQLQGYQIPADVLAIANL